MSNFRFLLATSKRIDDGEMVKSKYATAGPMRKDVQGSGFAVYNYLKKTLRLCTSSIQAAEHWDMINIEGIRRESFLR